MNILPLTSSLLVILASVAPAAAPGSAMGWQSRVVIHQRVIIRVPRIRRAGDAPPAPPHPVKWRERHMDRCIHADTLSGAAAVREESVDFVTRDGTRLRARLGSDCPALAFYGGFYLKPDQDGMICARRDVIRARSGSQCRIEAFRKLVAER